MSFDDFFVRATGSRPFPYQRSLATADLARLCLAAPTGAGKTAAAVLAWLWQRQTDPTNTPRRLVLCEPQRTLVEQVYSQVQAWLHNLDLLALKDDYLLGTSQRGKVSLHAMQGGFVDEQWELCPEQAAIIVGTQDQLLSRALNRGYAMSRFRWPVHFGLFHSDVQWVFDEVQLMGAGLGTTAQLHGLREKLGTQCPTGSLWMSATLNPNWLHTIDHPTDAVSPLPIHPFTDADRSLPEMAARLSAVKPLAKLSPSLASNSGKDTGPYIKALATEVSQVHPSGGFTLVILNTVDRAKALYKELKSKKVCPDGLLLLHSRFRPVEKERILARILEEGSERLVVTTQVVEAGIDISADVLITELSPRSSMIQRFGRCNRRGLQNLTAQVYWTDINGEAAAPYTPAELEGSRGYFLSLPSVEPARFSERVEDPWSVHDTIRRKDLLELFDTTPDLSGLSMDVGRFIRDGDERDIFVYWRQVDSDVPPLETTAPDSHEVCKVKIGEARAAIKRGKALWYLDDFADRESRWRTATVTDLVPGRTYLVKESDGLYDDETGFESGSNKKVVPVDSPESKPNPFPTMGGDPYSTQNSEKQRYLTLWEHTKNVCDELESIIEATPWLDEKLIKTLREVCIWHDVGKAHEVFQQTMLGDCPAGLPSDELWAKRIGKSYHSRRYFRHELASALAALQAGLPFLSCYLVASHHGKSRMSTRAFPDEREGRILGIEEGDSLPSLRFPGFELSETWLSLSPLRMGRGSWQDRCLDLLDEYGPFRLAYLEALVRAADVRASIKEKRMVPA